MISLKSDMFCRKASIEQRGTVGRLQISFCGDRFVAMPAEVKMARQDSSRIISLR